MTGSLYPVVSIKNGAQSAVKDCQAQFEYIDSFETVVLALMPMNLGRKQP
jgi:hypothetical protein